MSASLNHCKEMGAEPGKKFHQTAGCKARACNYSIDHVLKMY